MERINYDDKVALYENPDIADINKVNASDMNNIKSTINGALDGTNPMGSIVVDDISGKNIYNGLYELGAYNVTTGQKETNNLCYRNVVPIEVKSLTNYVFSLNGTKITEIGRIFYLDANGSMLSTETFTGTFTTPANCYYVNWHSTALRTDYPSGLSKAQIEQGSEATTYTPYMQPVKKTSIGVKEDTTFYANDFKCRNLYNENTDIIGYIINQSGNIVVTAGYRTSQLIEVKPNNKYVVSRVFNSSSGGEDLMRVAYYQSDGTFIERPNSVDNPWIITTPSNCYYVRVSYNYLKSTSTVNSQVQLEIGEATPYTPYKNFENEEIYSTNEVKIGKWIDGKDLYRKVYKMTNQSNSYSVLKPDNLSEITKLDIMQLDGDGTYIGAYYWTSGDYLRIFYTNNYLQVRTSKTANTFTHWITIEYTKTS